MIMDLLEKILEVVVAPVDLEKRMHDYYKAKINTKLVKNLYSGEEDYLKFWLLTNGDIIPVNYSHDRTASKAGVSYVELSSVGAISGTVLSGELSVMGCKKFTPKQISKLKNIKIEYKIKNLVASMPSGSFSVGIKSSKELAYYLEYGYKEEWESKNKGGLLEQLLEATASDIRRKHKSIKRLFPDFDAKTKGVEDKGGLRLTDQDVSTWKFKIHSGTKKDVWYDAYIHYNNIKPTLERMVKDRRLWVADKSRIDLQKLARQFMDKVDIQLFCSCPAFQYWGPAYILSLGKYDAKHTRREIRPPRVRNPRQYGMLCKHLDRLMKALPFYGSTMSKWIKDFYSKDIAKWEEEAKEEFGWVKKAAKALAKKRKEKPKEEKPKEVPEEEPEKVEVGAEGAPETEVSPEAGRRPEEEYF